MVFVRVCVFVGAGVLLLALVQDVQAAARDSESHTLQALQPGYANITIMLRTQHVHTFFYHIEQAYVLIALPGKRCTCSHCNTVCIQTYRIASVMMVSINCRISLK